MSSKKVVLIGLDAAVLGFFKELGKKGLLPNIQRAMNSGICMGAFSTPPPATSVNWNTIATGARAATHGVTAMSMHGAGAPLDKNYHSGFLSTNRRAETLWEAAERIGKKATLLKYPGSWPPTKKERIQVEGFGDPGWNMLAIAPRLCFANYELHDPKPLLTKPPARTLPESILTPIVPGKDWRNPPEESRSDLLEVKLSYLPRGGKEKCFYGLIVDSIGKGYDRVLIYADKGTEEPIASLGVGNWSQWITSRFQTEKGERKGIFRFKLMELSKTGDRFRLFTSQIFPKDGWTLPERLSSELIERVGPFQELTSVNGPYVVGWIDEQTLLEETQYHTQWLARAAKYLLTNHEWDIFFTQLHIIDHMGHLFLGGMDPQCILYEPGREKLCADMMTKTYQLADMFVGEILKNVDEETLVVITSDHGQIPIRTPGLNSNELLVQHGLIRYRENPVYWVYPYVAKKSTQIDWSRSKAYEACESFIYVNLKGREPCGIVEPGEEYEKVRNEIINILRAAKNPQTGDHLVAMALKREDAEPLGLYGEVVGDVIYLLDTESSSPMRKISPRTEGGGFGFTANHHGYLHSSGFEKDIFTERAVTVIKGPGILKGAERPRPIHLIDIAPTISYLMGWPTPKQSEGAILQDILE